MELVNRMFKSLYSVLYPKSNFLKKQIKENKVKSSGYLEMLLYIQMLNEKIAYCFENLFLFLSNFSFFLSYLKLHRLNSKN